MNNHTSNSNSDTSFDERQRNLMNQLCTLEKSLNKDKNHESSYVPRLRDLTIRSTKSNKIRGLKGRQSIFKRPEGPAPKTNRCTVPDYRRNPGKWTYYSLEDVEDMSNESNSQAAFAFLKELRKQKKQSIKEKLKLDAETMEVDEQSSSSGVDLEKRLKQNDTSSEISFSQPQKKKTDNIDLKPEFRNNKIIMPEYEVGSKRISKKKNIQVDKKKIKKNKELKLDHLQVGEDEE